MTTPNRFPLLALSLLSILFTAFAQTATAEEIAPSFVLNDTHQKPATDGFQPVGSARMRYLMWNVYDATLLAPNGQWQPSQPFGLRLTYLRNLKGKAIAERSIVEIKQQGFNDHARLEQWEAELKQLLPDVKKGTELLGVKLANGQTQFFQGQHFLGKIVDPEFGRCFFNIWLGDKTSEPKLRKQLLGLNS